MKRLLLVGGIIVLCLIGQAPAASATDSPYVLDIAENERNTRTLRLKNKKSGRLIWTHKIAGHMPRITWAKNRRVLVVEGGIRAILVWREGYRLRNFAVPDGGDGSTGCVWSPDNRRLLIRSVKSAEGDIGTGTLFCLRLGKWPYYNYSLVASGVAEMGWRNNKTVFYRRRNLKTMKVDEKIHLWRV